VRALTILCGELKGRLGFLHAKTQKAFWRGVEGVLKADRLWLTALGRGLPGDSTDKHRIKAADRLLGNENLQRHLLAICGVLASYLIAGLRRPCISVDWTGAGPHHHALTASLSFRGRSLPILTRIYPDTKKGSPKAEREFLLQLAQVVPPNCTPILITDAGFYLEWFERVLSLGWDFVGRLRGKMNVRVNNAWQPLAAIHRMARQRATDLGVVPMSRSQPREFRVVISSRRKSKGRKRLTMKGTPRRNTNSKRATKAAREPWVLATSVQCSPNKVVARYALRMQIEECFRDLKAHRHGWSLDYVRSKTPQRIEILLLLAALAIVAMHTIGLAAEKAKVHFGYQANTVRDHRVLSTFFLARLLMRDRRAHSFNPDELRSAMTRLRKTLREASEPA
jgi:hypothetical protein